jgi:hypothetical protein
LLGKNPTFSGEYFATCTVVPAIDPRSHRAKIASPELQVKKHFE